MIQPRISVVIATHNRHALLERLLLQLSAQTMPASEFEVVVVDDGSRTAVPDVVVPYRLSIIRQQNQGASTARHLGAQRSLADIVLFIDDDMEVTPELLSEHVGVHEAHDHAVVLGWIKSPDTAALPLFERFHARHLDGLARDAHAGRRTLTGIEVWSGNLSMRRAQYLRVGGFDVTLGQSEDAELGLRLEKDGATFHVSEKAHSIHHSDHVSSRAWRRRAYRYGRIDLRISRKHPQMRHASPWRYSRIVSLMSLPFLGLSLATPGIARVIARVVMGVATWLDTLGLERAALVVIDLAFGMQYTRGLSDECGGFVAAVRDLRGYLREGGRNGRPLGSY